MNRPIGQLSAGITTYSIASTAMAFGSFGAAGSRRKRSSRRGEVISAMTPRWLRESLVGSGLVMAGSVIHWQGRGRHDSRQETARPPDG